MDYIGIIFLAIILIYFISGLKKGFVVNLLESIKTIGLFILAFILCKNIGAILLDTGFGTTVTEKFEGLLLGLNNDAFSIEVTLDNKDLIIGDVWNYVPLPSALSEGCQKLVAGYIQEELGLTIGFYIAKALAYYVMLSLGFILILLVGSIIFSLIIKIFKKLSTHQSFISRLLGGVVGLFRALITISIYCYIISIIYSIMPSNAIGQFIDNSLNHEVGIFRFFYEHNLISYIFNLILGSL